MNHTSISPVSVQAATAPLQTTTTIGVISAPRHQIPRHDGRESAIDIRLTTSLSLQKSRPGSTSPPLGKPETSHPHRRGPGPGPRPPNPLRCSTSRARSITMLIMATLGIGRGRAVATRQSIAAGNRRRKRPCSLMPCKRQTLLFS